MSGPELSPQQDAALVREFERRRNGTHGRPASLRRLDLARMAATPPQPVPWVVEGLVARGMLTLLNGKEGEGKSLLAMCLGVGVATETEEAGLVCHRGKVMIVDAENGQHEIHRRVRSLGLPAEGVSVYEAEGFDLRHGLDQLEEALVAEGPDLLILDSFRSIWSGEENDSGDVAAVLDPLRNLIRRHDAGTLLLHHSGKGNMVYRGSSAIGASAELGFRLARVDEDPEQDRRYLQCWKCRPAPEPPRRWLRLSAEVGLVLIDEAEPFEVEEPERPAPARAQLTPKLLEALTKGPLSVSDLARAVGRKPGNGSVTRAIEALRASGDVHRDEDKRYRLSSFPLSMTPSGNGKVESGRPLVRAESGNGQQPDLERLAELEIDRLRRKGLA